MIVPSWINPSFQLIEGGQTYDWPGINALAMQLEPELPVGSRVAVTHHSVATLVAALVAAQRAGVELVLLRGASPRPTGASVQIEPGGRLLRLGPGVSVAASGFSVLIPTSGTTGEPKLVRQDFIRLAGRIRGARGRDSRWLLTYEPTAFGGIQVILAAITAGAVLVASPGADSSQLVRLALQHQVSHISATPCVWRTLLAEFGPTVPPLLAVTLGGDIADQPLLDLLAARFPQAHLRQIYASSEAGTVFTVADGLAGFPAEWLDSGQDDVVLRLRHGILEVRSPRTMLSYVGGETRPFTRDGWLITGDLVERVGDRVLFTGRIETLVEIDGVKVSPAKVETALLAVAGVSDVLVGAVPDQGGRDRLTALVVPGPDVDPGPLNEAITRHAQATLAPAERPQDIRPVDRIELALSGKKVRTTAFQYAGASPLRPHQGPNLLETMP
jgi:acyl-coenzyme A synthetase/AMP-(fatty) acid ligase